jgi:hypothetical protein
MSRKTASKGRLPLFALVTVGIALMVVLSASPASATSIVIPGTNAAIEGNTNNVFPFSIGLSSQRYQQAYGAAGFGSDSQFIDAILFRPDATVGFAFSSTLPNVQIDLSTTTAAVDGLSSTFASNVGANNTTVFSGALSLSSAFSGPAGGPKTFDILITLTTPFLYNPLLGNLLLDVRNFGGGTTTPFDAVNTSGDAVSRVFASPGGVGNATGTVDSFGLVTQFQTSPAAAVPEPISLVLVGSGCAAAVLRRRRRS